jgi:hypothetical protein
MDNSLPAQAKPRPKMPRKVGDLAGLKRRLWWSILHCEHILSTAESDELIVRTVHAMTQASLAYARLIELTDLEGQLQALEALEPRNGHGP